MKEGFLDESITIRCACSWETRGVEKDVILATIEHGRRVHNMTPSRDEVLAMAVGVPHARQHPLTPPGRRER